VSATGNAWVEAEHAAQDYGADGVRLTGPYPGAIHMVQYDAQLWWYDGRRSDDNPYGAGASPAEALERLTLAIESARR